MSQHSQELRERLAAIEHERWADWQRWLHSQLKKTPDGLLMTPAYYEHLEYQIAADYNELNEREKQSDREQVDRYWPLIEAYMAADRKQLVENLRSKAQRLTLTDLNRPLNGTDGAGNQLYASSSSEVIPIKALDELATDTQKGEGYE